MIDTTDRQGLRPDHYLECSPEGRQLLAGEVPPELFDVECIEALKVLLTPAEMRGFLLANRIKYAWRLGRKAGQQNTDLGKIETYTGWLRSIDSLTP